MRTPPCSCRTSDKHAMGICTAATVYRHHMGAMTVDELAGADRCSPEKLTRLQRFKWNFLGTLALILGIIGMALPVMPTAPFVLAAAACYLRGSRTMYCWLTTNRFFGPIVSDYLNGKGVSWGLKLLSITFLWASLSFSFLFFELPPWTLLVIVPAAAAVSTHVIRLPVKPSRPSLRRWARGRS